MRAALKVFLAAGIAGFSALVFVPVAEAGQPWWCVCGGKSKRYTASTHMCEKDLHKNTKTPVADGFKLLVAPCTRAQFIAWNTKLCKKQHCKPPKFSD